MPTTTPEPSGGADTAETLLDRLAKQHARALRTEALSRLELYHRRARTVRLFRDDAAALREMRRGTEEGIAVRLRGRGTTETRFAAVSGAGPTDLARALQLAAGRGGTRLGPDEAWAPPAARARRDRDHDEPVPGEPELADWLERAARHAGRAAPHRPGRAWVEVAETVESWVSHTGLRASRTRDRAWALLSLDPGAEGRTPPRPLVLAARGWTRLDRRGWAELLASRPVAAGAEAGRLPGRRLPVLFDTRSAATLGAALVRALHGERPAAGSPVGPGWRVADAPRAAGAPFGGRFDDAGFPTRSRELADGRTIVDGLGGAGHYRRPSFRDPPRPLAAHLEIAPERMTVFDRGLHVTELRLHALPLGEWILQLDGVLHDGDPTAGRPVHDACVRLAPDELVRHCVAGSGPPVLSHRGVVTPGLLFEDLPITR